MNKTELKLVIEALKEVGQDFREARAFHAASIIEQVIHMLETIIKEVYND